MGLRDGRSAGCQQQGDGSIAAGFWDACPEDWTKDYDVNNQKAITEALHRECSDWAPEYHAVIDAVDPASFVTCTLYHLPMGMAWENRPGFTILGDAAHLMSPFAGEGVNCSMADACELAAAIRKAAAEDAKGCDGLAPYVAQFEKTMRARTAPIQQLSWLNLNDWYYNRGVPHDIIQSFLIRNIVAQIGVVLPPSSHHRRVHLLLLREMALELSVRCA